MHGRSKVLLETPEGRPAPPVFIPSAGHWAGTWPMTMSLKDELTLRFII